MNSKDFPRKIYLMDDEFNDTKWSAEKNPYGEVDEDSLEYISVETVEEMLKERRQSCADAVMFATRDEDVSESLKIRLIRACLNAVEKK